MLACNTLVTSSPQIQAKAADGPAQAEMEARGERVRESHAPTVLMRIASIMVWGKQLQVQTPAADHGKGHAPSYPKSTEPPCSVTGR